MADSRGREVRQPGKSASMKSMDTIGLKFFDEVRNISTLVSQHNHLFTSAAAKLRIPIMDAESDQSSQPDSRLYFLFASLNAQEIAVPCAHEH